MTTDFSFMRYLPKRTAWEEACEYEEEVGRRGEAAHPGGAAVAGRTRTCAGGPRGGGTAADGLPLARCPANTRDRCASPYEQRRTSGPYRRGGTDAAADSAARGAHGARVWHAAVDDQAGAYAHRARVRRALQPSACLAPAWAVGLLQPEARSPSAGARRDGHRRLED